MRHRVGLFCALRAIIQSFGPAAACGGAGLANTLHGGAGAVTAPLVGHRTMAAYVIWDVRVVVCAGNVNKSQNRCVAWRIGGGGSGGGGVNRGCAIHSLAHALAHAFTRSLGGVLAPSAAPPVPADTCAMRPGHAFCYMLPA